MMKSCNPLLDKPSNQTLKQR